jgi:hypothetical protein
MINVIMVKVIELLVKGMPNNTVWMRRCFAELSLMMGNVLQN